MATIIVKGLSDETLKHLSRLKVDLDCDTWSELLEKLVQSRTEALILEKDDLLKR